MSTVYLDLDFVFCHIITVRRKELTYKFTNRTKKTRIIHYIMSIHIEVAIKIRYVSGNRITEFFRCTFAPAARRIFTTFMWFSCDARNNAVDPFCVKYALLIDMKYTQQSILQDECQQDECQQIELPYLVRSVNICSSLQENIHQVCIASICNTQ